jgi:hypothetical protein
MLGVSNKWYVLNIYDPRIYITKGDTLVGNRDYKILGLEDLGNDFGFIREDTIERKVFIIPNSVRDSVEIIYFDFSLEENDSILLYSLNYDSLGIFTVDSVRHISTLTGNRKAVYLRNEDWDSFSWKPVWVEGIGTLGDMENRETSPGLGSKSGGNGELSCFFKDGVKIYQSEYSQSIDTCLEFYSLVETIKTGTTINIFPNPASSEITIELRDDSPFSIYFYDLYGRLLFKTNDKKKIELNCLTNGTYILRVKINNEFYTKKLMILK